jgi:hypothetical protein
MFFSVGSAVFLAFKLETSDTSGSLSPSTQFAHIHFGVGGNDFGGVFAWKEGVEDVTETV